VVVKNGKQPGLAEKVAAHAPQNPASPENTAIATLSGRPLQPNRGIPLYLDRVNTVRVNTSAVERRAAAKSLSAGNLKQVFTNEGRAIDWFDAQQGEGRWFLEHSTQVKNIWVPYGE
jgi:hypothetical protein